MDRISLLIALIIFGLAFWLVQSVLPIPAPFKTAIYVILVVILIIWLLQGFGLTGHYFIRH